MGLQQKLGGKGRKKGRQKEWGDRKPGKKVLEGSEFATEEKEQFWIDNTALQLNNSNKINIAYLAKAPNLPGLCRYR